MARKNSFFKLDMLLLCIIAKQDCYGYEITKQIKLYSHELIDIKEEKGKEKLLEMINEFNNAVDGIHNVIKESLGEAYE